MPIYEYRCKKCGHIFDVFQRVGADGSALECPICGAKQPEKIFSAFASSGGDAPRSSSLSSGCGGGGGFT